MRTPFPPGSLVLEGSLCPSTLSIHLQGLLAREKSHRKMMSAGQRRRKEYD